jgi:hypothetical protein
VIKEGNQGNMDWTHSKPTYGTTTCKMAGFFGISKFG